MKFSFPSDESLDQASRDEIMSHLFTGLVLQHSQLAMMMLGRVADPDSGVTPPKDLESAKMFIDLLEMLEFKTRGNLTADEAKLLKEHLTLTREAFAEELDEHVEQSGGNA
ncbi:MAG: hypothetical protein K0Q55_699 [Verrucomicrobia bacterium]|jgi:hypothetical protein|nr:hypothetical protein [Verrucomicrobiota bacterium]